MLDHDQKRVEVPGQEFLSPIVGEHRFPVGKNLSCFCVMSEQAEARAPSAIEERIHM